MPTHHSTDVPTSGPAATTDAGERNGSRTAPSSRVTVDRGVARIRHLACTDPTVVEILTGTDAGDRDQTVLRMLEIGARAMVASSVGIDLASIDARVLRTVELATSAAEERVDAILSGAEEAVRTSLDPDTRTSAMARAIAELEAVRTAITEAVDPGRRDSHVGALLHGVTALLGPGGALEARLTAALDVTSESSGLGAFKQSVERQFSELRDLLAHERGRREEAESGTRKGFDFEDVAERVLREWAGPAGALVDRTSALTGSVGDDLVGDFVVTLPSGARIVVEAKNAARVGLNGSSGVLSELDRALANRNADVAVCVSASDVFPSEVGPIGQYGNRVLVVDDGEGTMLEVAMRWAALLTTMQGKVGAGVDLEAISSHVDRLRRLSHLFTNHRRALSDGIASIHKVRDGLDELRRELLTHLDEIDFELERPAAGGGLRVVGSG